MLGGQHIFKQTLTKIYTVYSLEKYDRLPELDHWWFMKEIKDEPDGVYYDQRNLFVKIKTKVSLNLAPSIKEIL